MIYYIAQAFGIVATLCCFAMPLFKKKWQMLLITVGGNLFFVLNLLLLGLSQGKLLANASAMIVNLVSLAQVLLSYWHVRQEKPVKTLENVIFLILYVGLGFAGYQRTLDLLPILGSVFNMLAVFQRDEQKTRYLVLCNASIFCGYYAILGSTSILAELLAMVTTLVALVRYRRKK